MVRYINGVDPVPVVIEPRPSGQGDLELASLVSALTTLS